MLRQDPTECLFSIICTSNNHISRIQGMVERLCQALGAPLCQLDQTSYYNFPSLSALAGAVWFPHRPLPPLYLISRTLYQCCRGSQLRQDPLWYCLFFHFCFRFSGKISNPGDLDLYRGQRNSVFSFKPCPSCLFLPFKCLDIRCKWEKLWHLAIYQCRKIHT